MKNYLLYPRVGIIGGAGPMAGALLFQKIIQICQEKYGCQKDADFPYLMLLNYPFADMLQEASNKKEIIKEQLHDCLIKLVQNEIEIVVIACNTLHEFLDQERVNDYLLVHMIEETALLLQQNQINETLVLCSTTSAKCQLHRKYFECFYLDESLQLGMQDLIDKILAGKQCREDSQRLVEQLNRQHFFFEEKQEERMGLVLGCTEFSVFNEQFPLPLNGLNERFLVLDPNQIVAEKICTIIFNKESN